MTPDRKKDEKMGKIKVTSCEIEGLYVIEPTVFRDERGYFVETYNQNDFKEAGLDMNFVQDNQSMSVRGVLRGLHYQKQFPQGKLVRVLRGEVFDVAVDLRVNSKTYGKWFGVTLSDENKKMFYIPEGFAHGFLENWPSDITVFINEVEVGTFHSPGDFGARRGRLTPPVWPNGNTQYGFLKTFSVRENGSFLDGKPENPMISLKDLSLGEKPYISLKIAVLDNAKNAGGVNIFGEKYGDYPQGIIMNLTYL